MRIFVTGATGVVGRRVVPILSREGHEVIAVGRSPAKRALVERMGATPVELDLFDVRAVGEALAGCRAVCNLATHIPQGARMFLPWAWRENDRLRRTASRILADAALERGVERFVQESFAPIYAAGGERWLDEQSAVHPTPQARTVLDAEQAVDRFTQAGRSGVVLRFGAFYGPDSPQLIDLIRFVRRGWAPLPGSPYAYLSSVSHDDAARAVVAALAVPPGIYNVVDDQPMRHRDWADALADALGVPPPRLPPVWMGYLLGSVTRNLTRSLRISNTKLRTVSAWAPRHPSVSIGFAAVIADLPPRAPAGVEAHAH
jgi:nucleoside-diphosphate-sugar epimerase